METFNLGTHDLGIHHGYFYGKGDSNEVVMSTCLHLFLSVFALGAETDRMNNLKVLLQRFFFFFPSCNCMYLFSSRSTITLF